jgi:hypothetical protein
MIRVVHPGSRIQMLTFNTSRIPGSKSTGSRIRIRNTVRSVINYPDPEPSLQCCGAGGFEPTENNVLLKKCLFLI